MMAEMKREEINTLVVDLQYNGGGNSQLGDVLLSWLYPHREMRRYDVDVRISELLFTFYPYYRQFTVNGEPVEMGKLYGYMGFDHSKNYAVDYTAPQDPKNHIFNFDDAQIYDGNVVFIQSRNSFSSSTLLLTLARDNGIGTIVGDYKLHLSLLASITPYDTFIDDCGVKIVVDMYSVNVIVSDDFRHPIAY